MSFSTREVYTEMKRSCVYRVFFSLLYFFSFEAREVRTFLTCFTLGPVRGCAEFPPLLVSRIGVLVSLAFFASLLRGGGSIRVSI